MRRHGSKLSIAFPVITLAGALAYGDLFVKTNGNDAASGADWDHALATISNAVALAGAGAAIRVSNGTYNISAEILIDKGIMVTGVGGRENTIVQSPTTNCRIFRITHADAVLDGFTITKGGWRGVAPPPAAEGNSNGAGIYMTAGAVRHCTVSNNVPTNSVVYGAGVYLAGGMMSNCLVCNNIAPGYGCSGVFVTNAFLLDSFIINNGSTLPNVGAGVSLDVDGVVSNCVIMGNTAAGTQNNSKKGAAGVHIRGGILKKSMIIGNALSSGAWQIGAGVNIYGGRMENCLIASNWCNASYTGAGISISGGTVVNCTIVANCAKGFIYQNGISPRNGAGVWWEGAGTLTNCIIYNNMRSGGQAQINIGGNAGWSNAFFSCCSRDLTDGSNGNISASPQFADLENGDFQLLPYSPCVDAGANIENGVDLDGRARPQDGRGTGTAIYDMGCYELAAATGYFNCYFQAQTNEAFNALDAVFTARVFGPNTNGLYYWWDFGNGTQEGAGLSSVTRSYTHGIYSVSLTVSNEDAAVTNWAITNYIRVGGMNAYVATNGAHIPPFDTWDKAATSILAAVQAAVVTTGGATRVVVSNGTYNISTSAASVFIDRGITVTGHCGASNTILWGTATTSYVYPDVDLDHPDAVVEGLTMGNANMGVQVHRGTVRNCILRNNSTSMGRPNIGAQGSYSGFGAGAAVYGGLIENCLITSNQTTGTGAHGAGVLVGGGTVQNCWIMYNKIPACQAAFGAGAWVSQGTEPAALRNCLVCYNEATVGNGYAGQGAGVGLTEGCVENCTIVSNNIAHIGTGAATGGGLYRSSGSVTNTIIYSNTLDSATVNNISGTIAKFGYSCAPELTDGLLGNITNEPVFVDFNAGNFHLAQGSPCINTGTNQDWMIGAADLDGLARLIGKRNVDRGCYQTFPPKGTIFATW